MCDFATDGFAAYQGFFVADDVADLLARVEAFVANVVPQMPPEHVFYEDKRSPTTLKQLQNMDQYDPWFRALFHTGRLRALAEELLAGPVVPKNMQFFNKPPGNSTATPAHQDGYYFMIEPCEAVTMWLALDPVDEETGCVRYVRGSHREGLRPHARTETLGFSQGIDGYPSSADRDKETAIPARPGDLLAHHAMTIHRADANRSFTRHRRAIGFIYYSRHAQEDTTAHTRYQQELAREWTAAGRL